MTQRCCKKIQILHLIKILTKNPPIYYHDKNKSNKNTQSINTSGSSHSSDESDTFSSSRINKSPNAISKTNLSKQSNEDDIEKVDLQNEPGPLINEYNLENKAKLHDSNLIRSENPNEVEKENNTTKSPNDNMFNQTPGKVLKLIQGNDSESIAQKRKSQVTIP